MPQLSDEEIEILSKHMKKSLDEKNKATMITDTENELEKLEELFPIEDDKE